MQGDAVLLKTGYFATAAKEPGAISIARFPPKWFAGPRYFRLAPEPWMLGIGDWHEYTWVYRENILARIDPEEVLRELGVPDSPHDIILLCFEKERARCHRGLVAEWFRGTIGLDVPEFSRG